MAEERRKPPKGRKKVVTLLCGGKWRVLQGWLELMEKEKLEKLMENARAMERERGKWEGHENGMSGDGDAAHTETNTNFHTK